MKFHPLSELFPLMQGREFDELVADIKANGLREAIWTYEGQILDGRNRWRACEKAGIEPKTFGYVGKDPLSFVVSLNLHRRHLDESQRSVVAAKVANLPHGVRKDQSGQLAGVTQETAAQMLNVGERSVRRARDVIDNGAQELVSAVEQGKVSVSAAADVAELPKDEQREIVARGEKEILQAAKKIRENRVSESRERRQEEKLKALSVPVPVGNFRTVVIDPPWQIEKIVRDNRPNEINFGFDYPTMTIDEIANLKLPLAEEAHVYLWTTQKYLPSAFRLLQGWGLSYVFTMTWHKPGGYQPFGLPQYNSEFVVFGRRGGLDFIETKSFFTCFEAPRREHSRKPDEFYELVKRVSPGPRIDMFSREPREGFEQFGNETKKFA